MQAGYVAAKDDKQFADLIKISFTTLIFFTLLTLLGALVYISLGEDSKLPSFLAMALPIYLFFAGTFNIFRGWNIKLEEFKRSAQSKAVATLTGKSTTLAYGWLVSQNALGMIWGSIIAFIMEAVGYITQNMRKSIAYVWRSKTDKYSLKQTFSEFSEYPKFVTTNSIIANFSSQIPIYFIAAWYSTEKVGLFSLALSLITIPINLLGTSVGAVLLPKISAVIKNKTKRESLLINLYKKLFYPGILGLILLAIGLKIGLPIILGIKWQGASQLSAFMALSFAFAVVALPISVTYRLINYERVNLILTIIFITLKVIGLSIGLFYDSFIYSMLGYFTASILHNALQVFFLFGKLNINRNFIYRDFMIGLILFVAAYYLIYNL